MLIVVTTLNLHSVLAKTASRDKYHIGQSCSKAPVTQQKGIRNFSACSLTLSRVFTTWSNDLSAEVQIEIKGQDLVLLPVGYSKVHFSTFRYFHGYFYFSNKLFDIHSPYKSQNISNLDAQSSYDLGNLTEGYK